MSKTTKTRYSDADLTEFKTLIEQKLEKINKEVEQMEDQSRNLSESLSDSSDMGESVAFGDVNFLNEMIIRQKKHRVDLENALLRIKNKRYGICMLTGQLIDKKRLLAVPTTTKSVKAKLTAPKKATEDKEKPATNTKSKAKRIKTKVVKKIPSTPDALKNGKDIEENYEDVLNLETPEIDMIDVLDELKTEAFADDDMNNDLIDKPDLEDEDED